VNTLLQKKLLRLTWRGLRRDLMGYKIKIEEIIGKTFGELTVISNAGTEQLNGVNTKRIVNCRVVCWWYNLSKSILSDSLVSGIINQLI